MESLQNGEILGEDCINSGLCWMIKTGICCANLEGEGVAVVGVRDYILPRKRFYGL